MTTKTEAQKFHTRVKTHLSHSRYLGNYAPDRPYRMCKATDGIGAHMYKGIVQLAHELDVKIMTIKHPRNQGEIQFDYDGVRYFQLLEFDEAVRIAPHVDQLLNYSEIPTALLLDLIPPEPVEDR